MAESFDKLLASLKQPAYTALTKEEMAEKANTRYQSAYNQKRLSAREAYETSDQALVRELESLQASYDRQRDQSSAAYRQAYAQTGRHALSRGMQRSSYTGAALANVSRAAAKALSAIGSEQAARESDIESQRTLAAQQLSRLLAQYDADQKADELAYMDQLEEREYNRSYEAGKAANEMAFSVYQAQFEQEQAAYQREQDALAQENWLREFNAKYSSKQQSVQTSSSKTTKKKTQPLTMPQQITL